MRQRWEVMTIENTESIDQTKPEDDNSNGTGKGQVQFTQEQLDAIIRDRLERATTKTTSDLMAQLGIEDIDQAKETLEQAAKLKTEQMTELEKAQAETAKAVEQMTQVNAQMEKMKVETNEALLKAVIVAKAISFNDPLDAWLFIDRSKIETDENGAYTGIDEALVELSESKPYLVSVENSKSGTPTRSVPKTIAERLLTKSEPVIKPRLKLNF